MKRVRSKRNNQSKQAKTKGRVPEMKDKIIKRVMERMLVDREKAKEMIEQHYELAERGYGCETLKEFTDTIIGLYYA